MKTTGTTPAVVSHVALPPPSPLAIPAVLQALYHHASCKYNPVNKDSLYLEFKDAVGHEYPWGCILEEEGTGEDKDVLSFEFYVTGLVEKLPEVGLLSDWFEEDMRALEFEKKLPPATDITEGGAWGVFGIINFGAHDNIRSWVASEFLPTYWPRMLAEADRLASLYRAKNKRFYNTVAARLCPQLIDSPDMVKKWLEQEYGMRTKF